MSLLAAGGYTIAPPPEYQKVSAKASKKSTAAAAAGEDEEEGEPDPAAGCCNPSDTESDDDADRMAAEAAAKAAGHRPNPSYVTQKVYHSHAFVGQKLNSSMRMGSIRQPFPALMHSQTSSHCSTSWHCAWHRFAGYQMLLCWHIKACMCARPVASMHHASSHPRRWAPWSCLMAFDMYDYHRNGLHHQHAGLCCCSAVEAFTQHAGWFLYVLELPDRHMLVLSRW